MVAVAAALIVAGCGDDDDEGASPPTAPPRSTSTSPAATIAPPSTTAPSTTAASTAASTTAPAAPVASTTTTRPPARTPLPGFGEIAFGVRSAAGVQRCGCALLADTPARRARGLMHVRDLGGYDGMLFVFPDDTTGSFYMKDTVLPLSIAWFQADGDFVSATDMDPCGERDPCPTYAPTGAYRLALEVVQGGLLGLGIGPGARLTAGASPCPPCPA